MADRINGVFVYRGRQAPQHITHARIDESVEEIEDDAFLDCTKLVHVETHNRIRKIGECAFNGCKSLPRIDLKSVVEICDCGFYQCYKLQFVEFGDKLESIGSGAFRACSIEHLKLPSVVSVNANAFHFCTGLLDVEFSEKLERVASSAFCFCKSLQRIAIPLKRGLFSGHNAFHDCDGLVRVDLIRGVHKTVASLHKESWRAEMDTEINRINLLLPDTYRSNKTHVITEWMNSVIDRLDHYKAEHTSRMKKATTLLELALWKAKLAEKEDDCKESARKKLKIDTENVRKEKRVTCGADTVIKNVLPFLRLE